MRQHPATDVAQVGGALGKQGILQRFLLLGGGFDHAHPRRLCAFTLLETGVDFVGEFRVVEHFLVGDENLADGFGLAAFDQVLDIPAHIGQGILQALALNGRGLAAQGVIEHLLNLDMCRANGNARRRGDGLELAAGLWRADHWRNIKGFGLCAHGRQWLDLFAQALFDSGQQRGQRIAGNRRFSNKFQHLATPGAKAQQLAQALHRHGAYRAVNDAHADVAFKTFGQLREDLRRPCVQAVGVSQGDAGAGPVRWQLTAEHFEHRAAAGGAPQFLATAFNQQGAQAFKQGLMGFTQAGQAEQAVKGLAEIAHGLVGRNKRQARALDRLLAVQPPQAITQGQRIDLLQHCGKPIADAIGLAQQACASPDKLFEVIGRHAQADHLRVQRQLLRCALQQFQQGFSRAGATQRLAQVGFTEGAGEQLQQAQVFVGFGGNTNGQVHNLPIAPVHAFGELQQAHASGKHLVAGFGGAMGDGNTLAKKGRALGFTGLQAAEIPLGDQAISHQFVSEQVQGSRFIHSHLAHGNLLYSELKHAVLLVSAMDALGIVLNKTV
ncbi:hypothetical protein BN1864_LIB5394:04918 [Pseudomonas sp. 1 R 17]|nr:hypothetical protein BN1864_LIB5394:04918 [Pseudomonas sp. 1 R 17]